MARQVPSRITSANLATVWTELNRHSDQANEFYGVLWIAATSEGPTRSVMAKAKTSVCAQSQSADRYDLSPHLSEEEPVATRLMMAAGLRPDPPCAPGHSAQSNALREVSLMGGLARTLARGGH